ncbi:bifunctional serine/threonine-protein kinase/ABC transporter substrate-binding protein [Streptomyces sp. NPDC091377]|uniref:bifunctional serine/threonine-protein kinase/ABC transporter substrate-binding protein n=1 Tax=Streptomyces sp. NPDC091377 TaxID=3365995 RepID=UPI0037FC1D28
MRPLVADDAEEIGGHRLLARLGAGGMGVVYLARTPGGRLVALKTIRAEHAADPAFRVRFRREVNAVRGLREAHGPGARWVVPVLAADPEAREPWLTTEFVPGPSLVEAVEAVEAVEPVEPVEPVEAVELVKADEMHGGFGALPPKAVRALGSRLADALAAVHDAGLVHRDVKPANVLLALDGPRLIDFGIAHASGATALTAPDAVVGTPGFLAPEQAQARAGAVGPPSDVFSLGGVLAYAASARRPFGTGLAAGVLFRTVHEAPDLTRVPAELRPVIAACLAKDPAERPTAQQLARALRDPRVPLGQDGDDWLPPALLRAVATRSAQALDIPTPRRAPRPPATREAPAAPAPVPQEASRNAPAPSRRRVLLLAGAAASVLATGGGITAYRAATGNGGAGSGAGLPVHTLGFQADLSGAGETDGVAQERGARLAVQAHNARPGITFRLALEPADDRGDPARAEQAARRLIDAGASAVLGLATPAAAVAAAPHYQDARTAMVLISADGAELTARDERLTTLCVTRAPESYLVLPLASYLTAERPVDRTAVIDDRAAGGTGAALAARLDRTPPNEGATGVHPVAADSDDFVPAVRAALTADAQAVVLTSTSPERAARCARALADADFTGPRLGTWHLMRPAFLEQAGAAAEGWLFGTPFTDPASVAAGFRTAHREAYGTAPARWSPEAYDAVGLVARALEELGAGSDVDPGAVAQRLFSVSYDGLAKPLRFTGDGTRTLEQRTGYFLFQARDGAFRFLGRSDELG